jgi:protein TonB
VLNASASAGSEGAAAAPVDGPASAGSAAVVTHAVANEPAALPTPVPAQSLPTARQEIGIGGVPPIGKKAPAIIPSADAAEKLATCPYPDDARRQMETGTVVLLVYVSQTGSAANAQVDTSSGSPSLDEAAVNCVKEFGQFTPRVVGKKAAGYWGRMKFNWSFGG